MNDRIKLNNIFYPSRHGWFATGEKANNKPRQLGYFKLNNANDIVASAVQTMLGDKPTTLQFQIDRQSHYHEAMQKTGRGGVPVWRCDGSVKRAMNSDIDGQKCEYPACKCVARGVLYMTFPEINKRIGKTGVFGYASSSIATLSQIRTIDDWSEHYGALFGALWFELSIVPVSEKRFKTFFDLASNHPDNERVIQTNTVLKAMPEIIQEQEKFEQTVMRAWESYRLLPIEFVDLMQREGDYDDTYDNIKDILENEDDRTTQDIRDFIPFIAALGIETHELKKEVVIGNERREIWDGYMNTLATDLGELPFEPKIYYPDLYEQIQK